MTAAALFMGWIIALFLALNEAFEWTDKITFELGVYMTLVFVMLGLIHIYADIRQ